jgi:hypothetical protein
MEKKRAADPSRHDIQPIICKSGSEHGSGCGANQGRHTEAHKLLASVYGWSTDGFEAEDLNQAKALLDILG